MQLLGSFYGLEQRAGGNRLFKVYVTNEGLFGGWIAPCDIEKTPARFKSQRLWNASSAQTQTIAESAGEWEEHLDALSPDSDEFLAAHTENFAFLASFTQASLTWKLKLLERAGNRFGALDLSADGGKKRRLYLVGQRTPDEVAAMLGAALPFLELEGHPVATPPFALRAGARQPHGEVATEPMC